MKYLKNIFAAALILLSVASLSATADAQIYGGRSVGASAAITNGGSTSNYVFADTGQLPQSGGNITISAPSASITGVLSTGVLTASTSGALRSSQSVTVANDVDINVGGVRVRANRVTVNAGCICCPGVETATCTASATFNVLTITDQAGNQSTVTPTGQANQVVVLPNGVGTLTLNEQVSSFSSIVVNGLHVEAVANGITYNITVASATSTLECASLNPTPGNATVSGRVLTSNGMPIARANITLTDSAGSSRSIMTNSMGHFSFSEVEVGSTYILQGWHKSYSFASRSISVDADMTVDIVAN